MAPMKGSYAAASTIRQLFDLGVKYSSLEPSFRDELIGFGNKGLVRVPDDMENERLFQEIDHLLQYLETRRSRFPLELEVAQERQRLRSLKFARQRQLWKLKDALDNADDVVDSSPYLDQELAEATRKPHYLKFSWKANIDRKVAEKCLEYIDVLRSTMNELNVLELPPTPEASSYRDLQRQLMDVTRQLMDNYGEISMNPTLCGGEEEKLILHHMTRSVSDQDNTTTAAASCAVPPSNYNDIPVISIVGLGGFGKTSLARSVYNNQSVKEYFNVRIWVRVHTRFIVEELAQYILRTGGRKGQYEFDTLHDLEEEDNHTPSQYILRAGRRKGQYKFDTLQDLEDDDDHHTPYDLEDDLKTTFMSSGRFLLVLDDVWNEDDIYSWESLFYLLRHGDEGSKILLTTRSQLVATMAVEATGGVDTCTVRLGASHCAVQDYWNNISSSEGTSRANSILLSEGRSRALVSLRSSYFNLPEHLRFCFSYCAIFPKYYEFNKKDLVLMWIALGFVPKSQYQHAPEIEGGLYFDALLARFFFQPQHTSYIMPDVIRELAQSVSVGECSASIDDKSTRQIPSRTVRHLYVKSNDIFAIHIGLGRCDKLRSLCIFFDGYDPHRHFDIFREVLKLLKSVRVLRLWVNGMEVLPDEVCNLKHLRYLELHPTICKLPKSMHRLLHLQVLKMEKCERCIVLPKGLRHLIVPSDISHMIDDIGKMCSLQEVSFTVMKSSGHKIKELNGLRELRELAIRCLENVVSSEEASMAELSGKEFLNKLELQWSTSKSSSPRVDKEVLEGLQPHSNIKELIIRRYNGPSFASWMTHLYNLEFVKLEDCSGLRHITCLGKFPFLRYLYLKDMPAVREICCEGGFLLLEILEIDCLKYLEEWSGLTDGGCWCPRLRELRIVNCPKMEKLPSLPCTLAELSLDDVGLTAIPTFKEGRDSSSSSSSGGTSSLSSSISLHSLVLHMCEGLMLSQGLLDALPNLRKLGIHGCSKLVEALASATVHISLDHLSIDRPSLLQTLPYKSLVSVEELIISDCRGLKSLYDSPLRIILSDLSSLKILEFKGADELLTLPKLPASLEKLSICGCNETLKKHLQKDEGIDWPKIAHIPNVYIQ